MIVVIAGPATVDAIRLAFHGGVSVLLEGLPGVGKSELIKQFADEAGIEYLVQDLSIMEPTDLMGLPRLVEGRTVYSPPSWLPSGGRGVLAIEELNRSPPYMMAPVLQLLTERRLNDYLLPDGWMTIAAINPNEADFQVNPMDLSLTSRFAKLRIEPDPEQWGRWATTEGSIVPPIIDFVRYSPNIFDAPESNPRAWTYASRILREWETGKYAVTTCAALLEGLVGEQWAAAFWQFYSNRRAPLTPDELIKNYTAGRATVRRWIDNRELDLVTGTLKLFKQYLKTPGNYDTLLENERGKKNARMFVEDLPGDIKYQMRKWLKTHELTDLDVREEPI